MDILCACEKVSKLKALVCSKIGADFRGVRLNEVGLPEPGPQEAMVRISAASLNFPDLLMLEGKYQFRPALPFVVGMDFAGVVESAPPGARLADGRAVQVGMRVAGGGKTGAFAEFAAASCEGLTEIPDGVGDASAAAYPAAYTTAQVALIERGGLKAGESLVVHGASGGVGLAAVDIGRLSGARVIATTGSADKVAALKAYGADHVLLAGDGFREAVKELTDGRGADVIFDPVGGDVFDESVRCIGWGGRLLVVGFAGGRIAEVKTNMPLIKGFSIVGVRAGEFGRRDPEGGQRVRETIWRQLAAGETRPLVHAEFELARWREAFELMRDRRLVGKVILRP